MRRVVWPGVCLIAVATACGGTGSARGKEVVIDLRAPEAESAVEAGVPTSSARAGSGVRVQGRLALGRYHSCARQQDGSLWCWGENNDGQLGDGTRTARHAPVQVTALGSSVADVVTGVGGPQSCARTQKGSVWCWGSIDIGDSTSTDAHTPALITTLGTAVAQLAISVDGDALYARKQDGSLWRWQEQYGISAEPAPFTALGPPVAAVALGLAHTCARTEDGSLWCWGSNNNGQLGDGTTDDREEEPAPITALGTSVAEIALGRWHSCARQQNGSLWCWGGNHNGQLGDGTTTDRHAPVQVTSLGASVAGIALGSNHSCALEHDGSLWCWGENDNGELGDGTTTDRHAPVQVSALGSVADVALGTLHTCARKQDESLWCWGLNSDGQLGDGTTTERHSPVEVRF